MVWAVCIKDLETPSIYPPLITGSQVVEVERFWRYESQSSPAARIGLLAWSNSRSVFSMTGSYYPDIKVRNRVLSPNSKSYSNDG